MKKILKTAEQLAKEQDTYQVRYSHQLDRKVWRIPCPAHNGDDPNCILWDSDDEGYIGAKCMSHNCSWGDIMRGLKVELPLRDTESRSSTPPTQENEQSKRKGDKEQYLIATYELRNGKPGNVYRKDYPHDFPKNKPCTFRVKKEKEWVDCENTEPHKHIWGPGTPVGCKLLTWNEDKPDHALVIVEGEKSAASLRDHIESAKTKYTSVSWKGGSGAAMHPDYSLCKGRDIILWPDNTDDGRKAMNTALRSIKAVDPKSIRIIPTNGDDHFDAADYDTKTAMTMIESAAAPPSTKKVGDKADPSFLPSTLSVTTGERDSIIANAVSIVADEDTYMHLFSQWWQRFGRGWLLTEEHQVSDALNRAARSTSGLVLNTRSKIEALDRLASYTRPAADNPEILNPRDRAKNFHLDTGKVVEGAVFHEDVVTVSKKGKIIRREVNEREFILQRRQYELPDEHSDDVYPTPLFDKYLETSFGDKDAPEATLLMEFVGRTLVQYIKDQKFIVLFGPGGSGKGTLLRLVEKLVGVDQCAAVSQPQELGKRFQTGKLVGRSILTVGDLAQKPRSGAKRDEYIEGVAVIKNITGEDAVTVEEKHRKPYSAVLNLSIWCATNHPPEFLTSGADASAWKRRMLIASFPSSVDDGKRVESLDEAIFGAEGAKIALNCIVAFAMSRKEGKYTEPLRSVKLMDSLIEDAQGVEYKFAEKFLERGETLSVTRKMLRKTFEEWGEDEALNVRPYDVSNLYKLINNEWGCDEIRNRSTNMETMIMGCGLKDGKNVLEQKPENGLNQVPLPQPQPGEYLE